MAGEQRPQRDDVSSQLEAWRTRRGGGAGPVGGDGGRAPAPARRPRSREGTEGGDAATVIGALLGAGIGAAIWIGVERGFHIRVGAIAILCGVLAGYGARLLGRTGGTRAGVISAVAGLLAIVGGMYASFALTVRGSEARQEVRMAVYGTIDDYALMASLERKAALARLPDAELRGHLEELFEDVPGGEAPPRAAIEALVDRLHGEVGAQLSFWADVRSESTGTLLRLVGFGIFGLAWGFRTGSKPV